MKKREAALHFLKDGLKKQLRGRYDARPGAGKNVVNPPRPLSNASSNTITVPGAP